MAAAGCTKHCTSGGGGGVLVSRTLSVHWSYTETLNYLFKPRSKLKSAEVIDYIECSSVTYVHTNL